MPAADSASVAAAAAAALLTAIAEVVEMSADAAAVAQKTLDGDGAMMASTAAGAAVTASWKNRRWRELPNGSPWRRRRWKQIAPFAALRQHVTSRRIAEEKKERRIAEEKKNEKGPGRREAADPDQF